MSLRERERKKGIQYNSPITGVTDRTIFSSFSNSLLLYSSKRFFIYSVAGLFKFR